MKTNKTSLPLSKFKKSAVKNYKLAGLYVLRFFQKHHLLIIMLLATIISMVARYLVILFPTGDSVSFVLNSWLRQIKEQGFTSFYQIDSDYSPLYLFMLAIISLLPNGNEVTINNFTFYANNIIYLKTVYYLFNIALAIGVYLLVKELTKKKTFASAAYLITIVLPTVFVNSAVWGNCDVIYSTFLIYSLYFALKGNGNLSFAFFGLAFANKLQSVFLLPFLVYFILNRKLKLYSVLFAPLAFLATLLPAYLCGASFVQPFLYIGKELNGYKLLSLGCANMWHLMAFSTDIINNHATWIALSLIGATLGLVYFRHIDLSTNTNAFKVAVLLTMSTIFFLPYMHERYFYLIDVLVVVYAFIDKKKFYFVPLMQVSSGIAYYHYLSGYYFIHVLGEDSVHIASFINLFLLCMIFYDVFKLNHHDNYNGELSQIEEEIKALKNDTKEEIPVESKND